jgi:hypothetical protein
MKNRSKSPVSRSVVLGALLLLAATASGCGVGLPTQPDLDQTAVNQRSAGAASVGRIELGEDAGSGNTSSGGSDAFVPDPEIQVPDASGHGTGRAWGQSHRKRRNP